jgi:hypothetical protein
MKTNFIFLQKQVLSIILLLISFVLPVPTLYAQTFLGKSSFTEPPSSLQVQIVPVSNATAVRIHFENQGRGTVHLQIRNSNGKVFYDELEAKRLYTGRFDLASLPAGLYTIELRTLDARHTEMIRVEEPTVGRVITLAEPTHAFVAQH